MAATMAGVLWGWIFSSRLPPRATPALRIGRLRAPSLPGIEAPVDDALLRAEHELLPIDVVLDASANRR